jgi:hypothetical protein
MFSGKRKRGKKTPDIDKLVSYKPFSIISQDQEEEEKREFPPLPDEEEYIKEIPIKFYDHQVQAVRWMYHTEAKKKNDNSKHVGGILGDVMGLGKTISSLGLIYYDIFQARKNGMPKPKNPTLIVAPLTVMDHWQTEAMNQLRLPEEEVMIYHGTGRFDQLNKAISEGKRPMIIITTYEIVQHDYAKKTLDNLYIFGIHWARVFLDEAHVARNPKTKTFRALKNFTSRAIWCVTGTPIVNYPDDVRMLSILCTPNNPLDYTSALQEMVWKKNHLLRRTKDMLDLPTIEYKNEWVNMSPEEFEKYRNLEFWAQTQYDHLVQTDTLQSQYQKILLVLVRLRQGCDHFQLKDGHDVTSKILELTKKELGLPLEPYPIKKDEDEEEILSGDDLNNTKIEEFNEDTCFIESDTETKKRKRKKQKKKNQAKRQKTLDLNSKKNDAAPQTPDTIQDSKDNNTLINTTLQTMDNQLITEDKKRKREDDENTNEHASTDDDKNISMDDKNASTAEPDTKKLKSDTEEDEQLVFEDVTSKDIRAIMKEVTTIENDKLKNINVNFEYSTKMRHLLKILEDIKAKDVDGKTVVFSQFTTMLDLVECMLLRSGYKVARFDGRQQKPEIRKNIIKTFRTNTECTVLLASLKAGGVGLNLLPARYLVLLDPWWNSALEDQAFDRIHRIGQGFPVTIYKILVNKTIEEEVLKIQKKKKNQEASFFDDEKKQILSVGDIHCVFSTMKTRQMKMMRLINTN